MWYKKLLSLLSLAHATSTNVNTPWCSWEELPPKTNSSQPFRYSRERYLWHFYEYYDANPNKNELWTRKSLWTITIWHQWMNMNWMKSTNLLWIFSLNLKAHFFTCTLTSEKRKLNILFKCTHKRKFITSPLCTLCMLLPQNSVHHPECTKGRLENELKYIY